MREKNKPTAPAHGAGTTSELTQKVRTLDFAIFEARLGELLAGERPLKWAKKRGFPPTTVADFLNRRNIPKAELLAQIARAEKVSVDWLLGLSEHRAAIPAPPLDADRLAQVLAAVAGRAAALDIALAPHKQAQIVTLAYQQAAAGAPLDASTIDRLLHLAA